MLITMQATRALVRDAIALGLYEPATRVITGLLLLHSVCFVNQSNRYSTTCLNATSARVTRLVTYG